jgi:plastocyanin
MIRTSRSRLLAAGCTLAVTGAALTPLTTIALGAKQPPASANVTLKAMKFSPATVTIRKGGKVTWTWKDGGVPHDVVGSGFRSRVVASGTFRRTFKKTGTFRYVCSIHAGMKGKVVVR